MVMVVARVESEGASSLDCARKPIPTMLIGFDGLTASWSSWDSSSG